MRLRDDRKVIGSPEANHPPNTPPISPSSSAVIAPKALFLAIAAARGSAAALDTEFTQLGEPASPQYQLPKGAGSQRREKQ